MPNLKFYMNNPCVVVREVTPDFSEVKLTPQFTDGIDGSQFCHECMAGSSGGTPQRHTCDDFNELIDVINDSASSIIVLVENRLLHDEPAEFKKYRDLDKKIMHQTNLLKATIEQDSALKNSLSATKKDIEELNKASAIADKALERKEKEIQALNKSIDRLRKEFDAKKTRLSENNKISVSGGRLRYLLKAEFVLERLEQGGLDNWEGYSESYPSNDEINEYCDMEMLQ